MIYVTHDQVEAMTMGQRICIMDHGKVVQVGTPLDVYRHPANTFVASFLGNPPMNLMPSELVQAGSGLSARLGELLLPLAAYDPASLGPQANRPVMLGIRPEDMYLPGQAPAGREHLATITAKISVVESLGAETILILALEGGAVGTPEFAARVGRDCRARRGDRIEILVDLAALHVFDRQSGSSVGTRTPSRHEEQLQ